jgi:carbamoyltransferase
LGEILVSLLTDVHRTFGARHLCLAGGLFYNTYFNTVVQQSRSFAHVFVPANPGNAGIAAGCALAGGQDDFDSDVRCEPSPFLGPEYDVQDIKACLDNCKLSCDCLSETAVIDQTVDALRRGHLIGWFQGRMEWGHRALGNRSIIASPLSPYVLDNLNVFLKQRERHRAYGLSVREQDCARYFIGSPRSRYMEYEYQLIDPPLFRHVVPAGVTSVRVQTVDKSSQLFSSLHQAFGTQTGVGVLLNTSFNGFNEPIVCSPRDAIRVFFGSGLDMLVLGPFVLRK